MPSLPFNPLNLLIPPMVIILAFPLAALAIATTAVATTLLWIRLQLVYLNMGIAVVHSWLLAVLAPKRNPPTFDEMAARASSAYYGAEKPATSPFAEANAANIPSGYVTPTTHFASGPAQSQVVGGAVMGPGGMVAIGSQLPQYTSNTPRPRSSKSVASSVGSLHSDSYTSLLLTRAPADRDYEGVGGWRTPGGGLGGADDADGTDEDDAAWSSLNARLELPTSVSSPSLAALVAGNSGSNTNIPGAATGTGASGGSNNNNSNNTSNPKRHVRSLTGSSSYALKMSPVLGRSPVLARSPAASMMRDHFSVEGYFGSHNSSNSSSHPPAPTSSAQQQQQSQHQQQQQQQSTSQATSAGPTSRRSSIGLFMSGLAGGGGGSDKKKESQPAAD